MTTALPVMAPRERHAAGCCVARVEPDLDRDDALRASAPEALCQCELTPLFDMSQQALSKHLKVLTTAGVVGSERRGLWAYYYLRPDALKELETWLT